MILDKFTIENDAINTIIKEVLEANLNGKCYMKQRPDIFLKNIREVVNETKAKYTINRLPMGYLKLTAMDVHLNTLKFLSLGIDFVDKPWCRRYFLINLHFLCYVVLCQNSLRYFVNEPPKLQARIPGWFNPVPTGVNLKCMIYIHFSKYYYTYIS
jgi:hypothetical protein